MSIDPFFSIVIPTCHRNDLLAQCLDRLAPGVQTLSPGRYEVVVSDDGIQSTAEDMMAESYPWARWVKGHRKGIAANRNNGSRQGRGQWFVFIDSDTLPEPDCLSTYAEAVEKNPNAIAFEGAIHPLGDTAREWHHCPINTQGGLFWTANVAIRKDVFEKVGGFDENYRSYHEDQDIYLRLLQIQSIEFLKASVVFHPVRINTFVGEFKTTSRRLRDWSHHVKKHGCELKQRNVVSATLALSEFHARTLVRSLRSQYIGTALLHLIWLVTEVFLFPYYYLCQRPSNDVAAFESLQSDNRRALI